MGGYRNGSGRSKSGYYKGIYCGSTYELCWVIHALDHNVKFKRFPGFLEKDGKKYFPDFLLDDGNTIIETKGFEKQESVDVKTIIAEHNGYVVKVLRKENLQYAFEYVTNTYNTKKFYVLYDEYKPQYKYICSNCKKHFTKDDKRTTTDKFCNRQCAGQFRLSTRTYSEKQVNSSSKTFSKEQALSIFNDLRSTRAIADEYSVTKNSIWFIKTKKTYKWIHNDLIF